MNGFSLIPLRLAISPGLYAGPEIVNQCGFRISSGARKKNAQVRIVRNWVFPSCIKHRGDGDMRSVNDHPLQIALYFTPLRLLIEAVVLQVFTGVLYIVIEDGGPTSEQRCHSL
jgi:hypothetical protein